MTVRYPRPLVPGDRIAVTSPSSGVDDTLRARLDFAIGCVEKHGYEVVVGRCMDGSGHISAPAAERAAELSAFLSDPSIRAVVPPWGGETAIDLVPLLDWERLRTAEPTWMVGYSDISTLITPLTLLTGVATVHGNNLMDTPYRVPDGLVSWLDIVTMPAGHHFAQTPPGRYRSAGWDDWAANAEVSELTLDAPGRWTRLDTGDASNTHGTDGTGDTGGHGELVVEGRLVGGCTEILAPLAGTPYLDTSSFARTHAPEGLIVYVEACEDNAFSICRTLHGMRLAGFFDAANAVLVGRTSAPDSPTLTQHEAVIDALAPLGVPVLADVDCGHVAPYLPLVNGALARVVHTDERSEVIQVLK
ncbi:S66 peptidase family protein [uncultured Streptomyces sp.]|uniref:S66 family peptidase n=1 Tax=uncultured Streptomyces sp. TaxID=174707 RepID=UPI0026184356|nr:S66 peptidase family protein [uncultured Streptomyces sp.]